MRHKNRLNGKNAYKPLKRNSVLNDNKQCIYDLPEKLNTTEKLPVISSREATDQLFQYEAEEKDFEQEDLDPIQIAEKERSDLALILKRRDQLILLGKQGKRETLPSKPGIYMFVNIETGRIYIGKAQLILRRRSHHLSHMRNQIHHNSLIRKDAKKYGIDAFSFGALFHGPDYENISFRTAREDYLLALIRNNILSYNSDIMLKGRSFNLQERQEISDRMKSYTGTKALGKRRPVIYKGEFYCSVAEAARETKANVNSLYGLLPKNDPSIIARLDIKNLPEKYFEKYPEDRVKFPQ